MQLKRRFSFRSHKLSFTPYLSLSPYRRTESQTEKQIHSLRVSWRNLFSSCAVVSVFLFLREIGFGVTYALRVQYSCGVVLGFWFWREIVFGVTYVLSVQYSCAVVSVFWLWREIVLKMRTPFGFLWAVSTKKSYWGVTLLWYASRCVYFARPNTLLLCIFLFWIFLLYCTDPQVEVQIRILLKDKYVKSCQNANHGNHTMISCTQFLRIFFLGFFILQKQLANQRYISHEIRTFFYCIALSCIVWICNLTLTIVSQKYQEFSLQVEISE
jgi:hypothetical protein